ncbi:hypothetical protein KV679_01605 [Bacillus sp. JRC01]|nr:hypothetical protein [Bacillus sp. JRC01]
MTITETQAPSLKKYSTLSCLSHIIGVTSVFLVFVTPTRIANTGSAIGVHHPQPDGHRHLDLDFWTPQKKEKKALSVIGLLLSFSFVFYWILIISLLVTGQIPFAP